MMTSRLQTIVQASRPPFLLLPIVCVALGVATVSSPVKLLDLILVVIAAVMANACVNLFNEYFDFNSGLDLTTEKTPFSGGSGALVNAPEMVKHVLYAALVSLAVLISIGSYFLWLKGWFVVPLGLLGIIIIITYTRYINSKPWLCLIAPGLGIGTLIVLGTYIALSSTVTTLGLLNALLISLLPFFLINNLLLLNQIPDIEADKKVGRKHFAIAYGIKNAERAFAVIWLFSMVSIVSLVEYQLVPMTALFALIPLSLSVFSLYGFKKHKADIGKAPHFLALNVAATLLAPLVVAIAIFTH